MTTHETRTPAGEFELVVSSLLSTYASSASPDTTSSRESVAYPDEVFDKVAKYLVQAGKQQWSLRPRTYIVLRLINRLDNMDAFILDGLFDIAFPYTYNRLPASLSSGARNAFLEKQAVVLSKAGDLEMEHGRHRHFSASADSNFVVVKQLGSGYFGVVDHVQSKLSLEEFARKRTLRARTFSKDKKALKIFENELNNLKRLSHLHLVKYIGSYTDPRYIGLLMSPVADCDLRVFLTQSPFPHNLLSCLRSFIGCLCAAVSYLHSQKCRHKDLKPGNILVKGDVVLISDFGTSRNWSDRSKGTTTGESGPFTPGYAAPEVVAWEARNESSDIWSLGCVFLDIVTVLKGESLKSKDKFFGDNGNGGKNPRVNPEALNLWLAGLNSMSDEDNQPISWIQQMLQIGPKDRISSVHLLDDILGHADHHIYYGHCCADQDEEASSCKSSEFEDSDTGGLGVEESTNATSVLSERSGEDKTLVGVAEIAPDKSTPSLIQDFVDGNPDSLTNKSGQSASPFESILRSRTPVPRQPDDTPAQDLAQYESIQRTVSQPEVPMWQSKNPFRPNYTPSHTSESAPPHGSVFQSPIQTQVNPFLPSPQEEAAPITGRDEVYDTAVKSPLSDNDATRPDALTDEASTAPENAPSTSAHHNLSIGSNPSLDTLNLLFDSAVNGDVSGISTYLSGGNELHEGAFAKSVFHAAAVNEQWAVMQLLIDAGCSVFPDDVTSYILPAIGNRQIEIDDLKITHRPILEQLKAVRTRKKHEALMLEDSLRKSEGESSGQDQSGASNEKENAKSGQVGFYTDFCEDVAKEKSGTFGTIEVPKSNFPSSYGMALGPWDPAGMHWDLTVTPDPELLHKVIRKGDYARVLSIINSGYSLNMRDEDGLSPLDVAIELGLTSLIRTLDVYGANPRLRDTHGLDAYDKAKARFFGEELRQVLNIFDQHKDTMSTTRPNDIQFPRYNNTTWNVFLEPYKEVPEKVARKKANESDQFEYAWPESWQIAVPTRYRWLFDAFGQLIWYEWPQDILDAYPGELFELEDTSMDTSTKTQWLIPKNPSNKPKWLRKLFSDTT